MAPKLRFLPMPRDDLVLLARNEATEKWLESVRTDDMYQKVQNFIIQCKHGRPKKMHPVIKGGYNLIYRLEYEDDTSVIMRVPIKDLVPFPDEKILYEVSTMRYVSANTTIPIPHVYHHGTAAQNPTGLGPFIIMDWIEHHTNMSRELLDPTKPPDSPPILDPNISEEKLELLYGQMANIILQLYHLGPFSHIGSLVEASEPPNQACPNEPAAPPPEIPEVTIKVKGRPLTINMADLITDTNAPLTALPDPTRTYPSSQEWYSALADVHMAQLLFQRNDVIEDEAEPEDDIRDKYLARILFRELARSDNLSLPFRSCFDVDTKAETLPQPKFRLFSEDLRPANVLLDRDLKVVGVIDWEFVSSAPTEFSWDPPWWLLLRGAGDYPGGIGSWMRDYEGRLGVFLRVLEGEEGRGRGHGTNVALGLAKYSRRGRRRRKRKDKGQREREGGRDVPLSQRMREGWETGRWMVNYAARKSWVFDLVWWRFLDELYFGPNEDQDHKARLGLVGEEHSEAMENMVVRKIEEMRTPGLAEWDENDVGLLKEMLI